MERLRTSPTANLCQLSTQFSSSRRHHFVPCFLPLVVYCIYIKIKRGGRRDSWASTRPAAATGPAVGLQGMNGMHAYAEEVPTEELSNMFETKEQ